jgi:hypothetical protein
LGNLQDVTNSSQFHQGCTFLRNVPAEIS